MKLTPLATIFASIALLTSTDAVEAHAGTTVSFLYSTSYNLYCVNNNKLEPDAKGYYIALNSANNDRNTECGKTIEFQIEDGRVAFGTVADFYDGDADSYDIRANLQVLDTEVGPYTDYSKVYSNVLWWKVN